MKALLLASLAGGIAAIAATGGIAAETRPRAVEMIAEGGNELIDYPGYRALVAEVGPYRAKRLLRMDGFRRLIDEDPDVLVLDARSRAAYAEGHIAGAVNLPLSDFTADSLAETIGPDRGRPILIYCNNNFTDNLQPVVTKLLQVALNLQTFTNLYGYGYRNVWELGEAVQTADPRVRWVGTRAGRMRPLEPYPVLEPIPATALPPQLDPQPDPPGDGSSG
ncbi:MAG: rhodanese-like domain-containing protein [Sphingomonadales bacterium]|nr:rhodanese-like domain-containing protein [Sphingomonadales bacterium]MBD3772874.1 rhodanese-like domain-containing protein [Paracoccaceae bacterium]